MLRHHSGSISRLILRHTKTASPLLERLTKMAGTDIEKKSLEAHVELCAERYSNLDTKLCSLEERMDKVEDHLVDIKNTLSTNDASQYKTLVTIGTTIIGVLITGLITLGVHIATK